MLVWSPEVCDQFMALNHQSLDKIHMAVCQNLVPLVNIKNSWDLWMFIPLKIVLIGIDPYTYRHIGREWMQDLIKIKSCFNASWSVRVSRSMVHGSTRELILYLLRPRTISFEGIKSWVNSVHIGSDTSCSFFPLLLYSACIYSSLFFSTLFVSPLPSPSFWFFPFLFSTLFK